METVLELLWMPTMRCNCRCAHCGIRFDEHNAKEMSGAAVAKALAKSQCIASDVSVLIAGGEPFLKDDLADFILPVLSEFENSHFGITTNGTRPQVISDFIHSIPKKCKSRVSFSISIDGLEHTHNRIRNHKNAYALALASAELLYQKGFSIGINTVIHQENMAELNELKRQIQTRCGEDMRFSFIPICTDVAAEHNFPYADEESKILFSYLNRNDFYEKYICAQGLISGERCNAGERNAVIMPSGELYVCCVGAAYKTTGAAKQYRMGKLQNGGFDTAWIQRRKSEALDQAKNCLRCNNPCDIEREHRYFGLSFALTEAEIERWFLFTGEPIYWKTGWHALERYEGGSHRWMAAREASVLYKYPISGGENQLCIAYSSNIPKDYDDTPMLLDIFIDGEVCMKHYIVKENEELNFFIDTSKLRSQWLNISFRVNRLWKPSDEFGSADTRELGIAVRTISLS